MRRTKRAAIVAIALVLIAGVLTYSVRRSGSAATIVGVVRTTEVRVEPEVDGQLVSIAVEKGAPVHAGDVLARLSAVELTAQADQARAALASATATRNNVYAGVRREQVASLKDEIAKASARLEYVQAQLTRTSTLARQSFESQQVQAASAAVAVLDRRLEKMILRSPTDGVVSVIAAEVGENIRAGQPILMIEATGQQWLSFNVREDHLSGLTIGETVSVMRNSTDGAIKGVITELRPLGTFATWQAERVIGDHDRNTLRLRLDPEGELAGLEPGMTVWIEN
jgi:HlyD family secretion protein